MDSKVKHLSNLINNMLDESERERKNKKTADNLVAAASANDEESAFISAEQRMSIQNLLMEFYRILQRDEPKAKFSDVSLLFTRKFKIKSLEFITTERFDEIVLELLNSIGSYGDMPFNGVAEDDPICGFSTTESIDFFTIPKALKSQNIVRFLLGDGPVQKIVGNNNAQKGKGRARQFIQGNNNSQSGSDNVNQFIEGDGNVQSSGK